MAQLSAFSSVQEIEGTLREIQEADYELRLFMGAKPVSSRGDYAGRIPKGISAPRYLRTESRCFHLALDDRAQCLLGLSSKEERAPPSRRKRRRIRGAGLRLEDIEAPISSAEAALMENAREKAVQKCMKELTDVQREVLVLRTVSELAYEEIASMVRVSLSSVKSLIFRAKQKPLECIQRGGHADV